MKNVYLILVFILLSGCQADNSDRTSTGGISNSGNSISTKTTNTHQQNSQAAVLYERYQPCHGQNAEKNALGKSKIIANSEKKDLVDAINAYKNGTRNIYGFGGLMKGQVAKLTENEIIILSDYISQF